MSRHATQLAGLVAAVCWLGVGVTAVRAQEAAAAAGAEPSTSTSTSTSASTSTTTTTSTPTDATEAPASAAPGTGAAAAAPTEATPAPKAKTTWKPSMAPPAVPTKKAEPAQPPPPAKDGPFALGASFTPRWNSDPSYDFFADDDVTVAYGLWLGYDLFHMGPRFALAAELGWSTEHEEQFGLAGGTLDTEMRTCAWELSGDLRWEALPVLWPHIRLGGGFAKSKLHLDSSTDGNFEDTDFSGTLVAGLGTTLKTPPGTFALRTLSLGLRIEVGYRVMAPTVANLEPEDGADDDAIPVAHPSLGEVSRSGPYVGVSLVVRI